jgi:enediyne biosynthesis protein E4
MMTFMEDGVERPLLQREVYVKHMPMLKKKFLYNEAFAKAAIEEVWPKKDLNEALNLVMYELSSCWWENQNGRFVKHILPFQAQVSVVQGILVDDFNKDGNPDLLLAGNKYGFEVETNHCDASNGAFFAGDGKGNFNFVENLQTGFWAQREARDLALLRSTGGKSIIVVSNNNGKPQVYQY